MDSILFPQILQKGTTIPPLGLYKHRQFSYQNGNNYLSKWPQLGLNPITSTVNPTLKSIGTASRYNGCFVSPVSSAADSLLTGALTKAGVSVIT